MPSDDDCHPLYPDPLPPVHPTIIITPNCVKYDNNVCSECEGEKHFETNPDCVCNFDGNQVCS